jgi:hypothetical protein
MLTKSKTGITPIPLTQYVAIDNFGLSKDYV